MVSAASQIGALSVRLKKQEAEKKKKDFDRKGSNGRKIRYVPIPQLLGFMVSLILSKYHQLVQPYCIRFS